MNSGNAGGSAEEIKNIIVIDNDSAISQRPSLRSVAINSFRRQISSRWPNVAERNSVVVITIPTHCVGAEEDSAAVRSQRPAEERVF